jgi:hypothetical protein
MGTAPTGGPSRRGFLLGAATGLAAGVPLTWLALRHDGPRPPAPFTGRAVEVPRPDFAMPGPYPGRVVEVRHPAAVLPDHRINPDAVRAMMGRGMTELTGAGHPAEAWRRFFGPGDVVGVKVNPVGRKPKPGEGGRVPNAVGSVSSPAVVREVVAGLVGAGVRPRDIILFERYAQEFIDSGYEEEFKDLWERGVRWYASAARYSDTQVDLAGFDYGRVNCSPELARHVAGYDPDVFVHMGYAAPQHDPKDDRRFRTHLSLIVSRMIDKMVTIPVLKDHRSAGVTLALKNISHGMNSNVARSHISGVRRLDGSPSGPNQCNTFIPTAAGQRPIRLKATLHVLDGLIGVYEGGPGSWNRTWATWHHRGLFFATDPVALDHVGWAVIDAKRAAEGWPPVEKMGLLIQGTPPMTAATGLAPLGGASTPGAVTLAAAAHNLLGARQTESFDVRQPQHVILAGKEHGLGVFDAGGIEYRSIQL